MSDHDVFRAGKVHVMASKCNTCIFWPDNRMQLSPGRLKDMIEESRSYGQHDGLGGGTIVCHHSIFEGESTNGHAICRGWYDAYGHQDNTLRLATIMGIMEEVTPSGDDNQAPGEV